MADNRYDIDITRGAEDAHTITPNDSTIFPVTRGLYIGTAGAITVLHEKSFTPVTYPTTIAGYIYPWHVIKVLSTGTAASDIIGQY